MLAKWLRVLVHPFYLSRAFYLYCALYYLTSPAAAQFPVNGQIFTNGLSIVDSPNIGSQHTAGGVLPIAIEVTGNGKLSTSATIPGSGLPTRYDALAVFLVSSQTNLNVTVTSGQDLLMGDSGTVKHLNWPIPTCVFPGSYNLTLYESSHIDDSAFFTITSIPISVMNSGNSGELCPQFLNTLEAQPQVSSPSPQSPFLPGSQFLLSATPSGPFPRSTSSGMLTSVITSPPPTITITLTAGGLFPSDYLSFFTHTPSPTTETVVLVSVVTRTTTVTGKLDPMTTVYTTIATTTAVVGTQGDTSGFIPVNSAPKSLLGHVSWSWVWVLGIIVIV